MCQKLPPGLLSSDFEFFASDVAEYCLTGGKVYIYSEFTAEIKEMLEQDFLSDTDSQSSFTINLGQDRILRTHLRCKFGGFDDFPDFDKNGLKMKPDFYDCGKRGVCPWEGIRCKAIKVLNGHLTKRELEIVQLISKGLLNKEIADKLDIADTTVPTHIQNIYEKTGIHTKVELAVWARTRNI